MRLLQRGLQSDAAFEGFGGRREIVLVLERQSEVVMRAGVVRLKRYQLPISLDRGGVIGLLHLSEAEVVESDLVVRVEFEYGVEFGDRRVRLALLDQRERQIVASLKLVRIEFYARAQGFDRVVEILIGQQRIAERRLNVREFRI